jgi:DNA-binding NtrC family response regulator
MLAQPAHTGTVNNLVLVADNDEEIRHVLTDSLGYLGANIVEAANVYEVFERVAGGGLLLVVTDLEMPGGSVHYIGELRRRLSHSPILVVTALDGTSKTQVIRNGASAYLKKPFRIRQLRDIVEELLGQESLSLRHDTAKSQARRHAKGTSST